jgi:hypothetical protein
MAAVPTATVHRGVLPFSCPFRPPTAGLWRQPAAHAGSGRVSDSDGVDVRSGHSEHGAARGGKEGWFRLRTRRSQVRVLQGAPSPFRVNQLQKGPARVTIWYRTRRSQFRVLHGGARPFVGPWQDGQPRRPSQSFSLPVGVRQFSAWPGAWQAVRQFAGCLEPGSPSDADRFGWVVRLRLATRPPPYWPEPGDAREHFFRLADRALQRLRCAPSRATAAASARRPRRLSGLAFGVKRWPADMVKPRFEELARDAAFSYRMRAKFAAAGEIGDEWDSWPDLERET